MPWYLTDLILPLLVTFITYLSLNILLIPVLKWRNIKEEIIVITTQYANYKVYVYIGNDGTRKFDDRGLHNIVEQDLRKLAGKINALQYDFPYNFWVGIHLLPTKEEIENIRGALIGWANSLIERECKYNSRRDLIIESLKKYLNLPNNYQQMKDIQEQENGIKKEANDSER